METILILNRENVSDEEAVAFRKRKAVRGVIFDDENNVAILHAVKQGYYGLPGGGVDDGENHDQAIVRECQEELGCNIEIISEIGKTLEYRKENKLLNESCGYTRKVIGEKGVPVLLGDENEAEKNSLVIWVPIDQAIKLMETTPIQEKLYSQDCIERDLAFLKKSVIK